MTVFTKKNKNASNWVLKKIGFLLAIAIFFTLFTACTIKDRNEVLNDEKEINKGFPIKIVDAKGTEIEIKDKPGKIISLTLPTDEIILSLVEKERIAALSYLSEDPGLSNVVEEAKKIPNKMGLELETLISMQPDLVIVADWTDEGAIKQLRDAGIVVYSLQTPNNIEEVKDAVLILGELVGEEEKGQEIINWMDKKLKAIGDKLKGLKDEERPRVLFCDSFFCTYGEGSTFDDIAKKSGVINIASEQGMGMWQEISKEKIVELNPDILILPSWSFEGFEAKEFTEDFKTDKSLAEIKAIKNDKVFNLPDAHIISTSQNIVLGVEDVAKAAYPELFK
jgi:iron complex transport system substrate-binding protein